MIAKTTNAGRSRFNPNIYANGKVCLSILGTWTGESGEQWSSAQGIESVLISIQSLMCASPYENEPGFEAPRSEDDKANKAHYIKKIRHETLRLAVVERLEEWLGISADGKVTKFSPAERSETGGHEANGDEEPPLEHFQDLCKRRFLWYYDSYLASIERFQGDVKEGEGFQRMPFESTSNEMLGEFHYPAIKRRLQLVRQTLDRETESWAQEGAVEAQKDAGLAENLKRTHQSLVERYRCNSVVNLDLDLVEKNPFLWQLTYFGRPMTQLDGGMFTIHMHISPRFPEEQPRVVLRTPLFHHRISEHGVLCYFVRRADDIKSHVEAIVEALEDTDTPYDPRALVNLEASKLYWGSADDRKQYNRLLRRAVVRSTE